MEISCRRIDGDHANLDVDKVAEFFAINIHEAYFTSSDRIAGRPTLAGNDRTALGSAIASELRDRLVNDSTFRAFECRLSEAAVGYAVCSVAGQIATIEDVVLRRDLTGHGVGAIFLDFIERNLKAEGVLEIYAEVAIQNDLARKFFERRQYQPSSTTYVLPVT